MVVGAVPGISHKQSAPTADAFANDARKRDGSKLRFPAPFHE
jgi:hypothetical protein